jgi:hypothetical protein
VFEVLKFAVPPKTLKTEEIPVKKLLSGNKLSVLILSSFMFIEKFI